MFIKNNKSKSIEIIDNFLSEEDANNLRNLMLSESIDWKFIPTKVDETEEFHFKNFQFYHMFYFNDEPCSVHINALGPLLKKINYYSLIKIKANMVPHADYIHTFKMHTDQPINKITNKKTGIYYLNTNNGKTVFENGAVVESIFNRYVEFDAHLFHTGTTCTNDKGRILINLNYIKND